MKQLHEYRRRVLIKCSECGEETMVYLGVTHCRKCSGGIRARNFRARVLAREIEEMLK